MQRYFISEKEYMEGIILSDDVFHIVKVMRNKVGDLIEICYDNKAYLAKITNLSNELVNFEIVEKLSNKKQNKPNITLIQGLAKGDKNDDIIKHSTELGVDEIILLQMKRSIVKIEANKVDAKLNRYKKIAKEASEQSHRNSIPEVKLLTNLNNIDFNNYDLKLLLDEEEAKKIDGRLLSNIDFNNVKNVIFVIGPEGGIDDKERLYFIEKGFTPVSIGDNILRTETASLAFLAMINYIYMKN
jgi:16S rRNA (uracil1498-N3)-methyltransferase